MRCIPAWCAHRSAPRIPGDSSDCALGAAASIHVASAPDLEQVTGRDFANSKLKRSSKRCHDEADAARLWEISVDLVAVAAAE
jgi:hypothetical protein